MGKLKLVIHTELQKKVIAAVGNNRDAEENQTQGTKDN